MIVEKSKKSSLIIYVDDVVHQISLTSYISLYADDVARYRCIRSPTDYVVLQSDITAIYTWVEEENYLKLHPDKWRLMFISRKCTHSITPPPLYINKGSQIQSTDFVKYLGIILTSDLTWSAQITVICAKTQKLVGLFYQQFHMCSPNVKLTLYKAFIRPNVEYKSQIWDPHLLKDVDLLEKT